MTAAEQAISFYACQFGQPGCKGAGYLGRVLIKYVERDQEQEAGSYNELLKEVCLEKGVQPSSARRSIQRYIENGWKDGYNDQWRKVTGWSEEVPPDVNAAIRLICESYCSRKRAMENQRIDKCPNCGGEVISAQSDFCAWCGAKLREPS